MKNQMLIACVLLASFVSVAEAASKAARRGTAILHYQTRTALTSTEAAPDVTGSVRLQVNEQGRSSIQKFNLNASGLEPRAQYILLAAVGDDTNVVNVATVRADRKGRLAITYTKLGQGKGGRGLPNALNPLTDIRAIELQGGAETQTVAFAWINTASNFNYTVKRNLTQEGSNSTASGSISLIANQDAANFHLVASGLNASNTYHLALNSVVADTVTADENGRIEITTWPAGAPAILDLRSLAIWDDGNNVVLTTTLPK